MKNKHINIGSYGVAIVMEHLKGQKFNCVDKQTSRSDKGYDILAKKNGKVLKIEVKTTQKFNGIPDCHNTEFDKKNKFIADLLYIVRLDKNKNLIQIEKLTKDEINKYTHKTIERIRISSTLKTDLKNRKIGTIEFPK